MANQNYLETKVQTASQPQLQLMLLDGASRFCRRAIESGTAGEIGECSTALDKTMSIVEELLRSVAGRGEPISAQLEEQYEFLFRELASSRLEGDLERLAGCLQLIDFQRDTWRLAIEKNEIPSRPSAVPTTPHIAFAPQAAHQSLSLEA